MNFLTVVIIVRKIFQNDFVLTLANILVISMSVLWRMMLGHVIEGKHLNAF